MQMIARLAVAAILFGLLTLQPASVGAQAPRPLFLGLGDSIGEGVQSADASVATQPFSFLNIIALLSGAPFPQPYIQSGLFGSVGDISGRSRINPEIEGLNLAVSGANIADLLFTRADALSPDQFDSEADLVLYPRRASQIEIAEAQQPQIVACWIGNNDALGSVTDSGQLDGVSNLTPVPVFQAQFQQLAARLAAMGSKVVFGTIPDVTGIGYLLNRADLVRVAGGDYGLPDGSYTTLGNAIALRLGILPADALAQPNLVLDAAEAANINTHIDQLNGVIRAAAAAHGMGVADVAALFDAVTVTPLNLFGVPITTRFLGGLFSLDGVHPSNLGHVIVAQLFIDVFNQHYGLNITAIGPDMLGEFFFNDPFIDKDRDGKVVGRLGAGLLESAAILLGWSGDTNDAIALPSPAPSTEETLAALSTATGTDLRSATPKDRIRALDRLLTGAFRGRHQR